MRISDYNDACRTLSQMAGGCDNGVRGTIRSPTGAALKRQDLEMMKQIARHKNADALCALCCHSVWCSFYDSVL